MRTIGLLTFGLLLVSSFGWGQQALYENKCIAIVQGQTAQFIFDLPKKKTWIWNMKETADNSQEYTWEFALDGSTAAGKYSFGVYLFKFPGAQERIGNFNQLVADAQASVWDQSLRIREDLIIQPKIEDEKLILVISDKKTFSELFSQDPTIANCRVRTPYNDINYVSKTRIKVYN